MVNFTPTGSQSRRNSLRAASFGPPTVSFVLAIARTCIRQAPPTFRGRGLAMSAGAELLPGAVDLLRKVLVYDERKKAGEEVGSDAVVASEKEGTCRRSRK